MGRSFAPGKFPLRLLTILNFSNETLCWKDGEKRAKLGGDLVDGEEYMKRLVVLLLFGSTLYSTPLYAKTWAAQFPYGAGELSPVFHAESRENVLAKAEAFCQKNALCRDQYESMR